MVIVNTSIPLAIFCSVIGLNLTGNSINIMTLGGLALAIGMLVDDATVEVENIHRNRHLGKPLTVAILNGAQQIAVPAIVATLAICIVFFPVVLLVGPAKFLFTPLALAVVLAMLASYLLSRTLVPVLARLLMASEPLHPPPGSTRGAAQGSWPICASMPGAMRSSSTLSELSTAAGSRSSSHRAFTLTIAALVACGSLALAFVVGTDFFPSVDAGLMKLHCRAPSGSRIGGHRGERPRSRRRPNEIVSSQELETINDMLGSRSPTTWPSSRPTTSAPWMPRC